MSTGNIHLIIDRDIHQKFMDIVGRGNVTKSIRDYMIETVARDEKDIQGISIKIINNDLQRLQKTFFKTQAEIRELQALKEKYEESKQIEEQEKLKIEKQNIEKQNHCIKCASLIVDGAKKHKTESGLNICNGCFISTPPMDLSEWMKK